MQNKLLKGHSISHCYDKKGGGDLSQTKTEAIALLPSQLVNFNDDGHLRSCSVFCTRQPIHPLWFWETSSAHNKGVQFWSYQFSSSLYTQVLCQLRKPNDGGVGSDFLSLSSNRMTAEEWRKVPQAFCFPGRQPQLPEFFLHSNSDSQVADLTSVERSTLERKRYVGERKGEEQDKKEGRGKVARAFPKCIFS